MFVEALSVGIGVGVRVGVAVRGMLWHGVRVAVSVIQGCLP